MSKTISFVASDDLAEYLEAEAKRRMTTVSSTAQMLLAEKYRAEEGGGTVEESVETDEYDALDRHSSKWYRSDGQHKYGVHVPESADIYDAGDRRYYDTKNGVREALKRWYE